MLGVVKCERFGQKANYHFYLDTGMGRMGYSIEQSHTIFEALKNYSNLNLLSLYSHFSVSDEMEESSIEYTRDQMEKLKNFCEHHKLTCPVHIANSGGVLQHKASYFNFVRPGLLSYGIHPNPQLKGDPKIKPILKLKCKPLFIKRMKKGESVGYGRETILENDATIATLPVGYADGVPRSLAQSLKVTSKDNSYSIAGRICMDMMMVNLENNEIDLKEEFTLLGDAVNHINIWSKLSNRIPYELLTNFGKRWSYVYLKDGKVFDIVK